MFQLLLFLHILSAIAAFGPSFAFPLIGAMGGREREHGNFALRLSELIEKRLVIPIGLTMPITGAALIYTGGFNLFQSAWLLAAIVIYVAAMGFALLVQTPTIERLVEMTDRPPLPAGPGAMLGGPPPEMLALVQRTQRGGMLLSVAVVAIVFLMVVRPG
jgi:uncharacterized membrane protein